MLVLNNLTDELKKIHNGKFPFPDLRNPLYISRKTVIDDGKMVGGGLVRLTGEGILILDESLPRTMRARAAEQIVYSLMQDVKNKGLDECHVFVRDPNVQKFLRHLGFVDCQGGDPLVIHF